MAIEFTTEARVRRKFGGARWLEYFDDDGDGVADTELVEEVLEDANSDIEAFLMGKGFTSEKLEEMAGDAVLARIGAAIAMGYAGERRPEWLNDEGVGPFEKIRAKAYEKLEKIATARLRIPAENQAGANTQLGGRLSKDRSTAGTFIFAQTAEDRAAGKRGPGGF